MLMRTHAVTMTWDQRPEQVVLRTVNFEAIIVIWAEGLKFRFFFLSVFLEAGKNN